ncbi:MAG TPA: carboxymuconolactone decarboxylase family protein [Puia sp.]|nr:carboxymuconolactone decarboxylase family protein [Puia sp.]
MSKRIVLKEVDPESYKVMLGFEKYIAAGKVNRTHKDLIKIRASQINGCAYCVDQHTREAREAGETEQRIFNISVWKDTPLFTEEERAILALTEEVTLISHHVSDSTYDQAAQLLGDEYLAKVLMTIIAINSWNRIGIATGMQPVVRP